MSATIPPLVLNWPYNIIVLVWDAIPELLSSGLLKDSYNCRDFQALIQHPKKTAIVSFDMYPNNVAASITNLYGCYPVLVFDVSGLLDVSLLQMIYKDNRTIYALNLPFYMERTISCENVKNLCPLIEGSKRVAPDQQDDALKHLKRVTNKLNWNVICCVCFKDMQGLGTIIHDDHQACEECAVEHCCYHYSHKLSPFFTMGDDCTFLSDADLFLDWSIGDK